MGSIGEVGPSGPQGNSQDDPTDAFERDHNDCPPRLSRSRSTSSRDGLESFALLGGGQWAMRNGYLPGRGGPDTDRLDSGRTGARVWVLSQFVKVGVAGQGTSRAGDLGTRMVGVDSWNEGLV